MDYQHGAYLVYDIKYHLNWATKYRYHVLKDEVATRAQELIRLAYLSRDVTIGQGCIGKDHVHMIVL